MSAAAPSTASTRRRARTRKSAAARPAARRRPDTAGRRWLWVIGFLAFSLLVALSVASFDATDTGAWSRGEAARNWIGPVGHVVARTLLHALGISAYGAAFALLFLSLLTFTPRGLRLAPLATFGCVLLGSVASALAHLLADAQRWSYPPGGALGRATGDAVRGAFSFTGSLIVLGALLLMAVLLATHFAAARAFEAAARGMGRLSVGTVQAAVSALERRRRIRALRAPDPADEADEDDLLEAGEDGRYPIHGEIELEPEFSKVEEEEKSAPVAPLPTPRALPEPKVVLPDIPPQQEEAASPAEEARPRRSRSRKTPEVEEVSASPVPPPASTPNVAAAEPAPTSAPPQPAAREPAVEEAIRTPAIVEPRPPPRPMANPRPPREFTLAAGRTGFHLPTSEEILEGEITEIRSIDRPALTATAERLRQKLLDLGVEGEVTEIRPGPVVTMYEFRPAAGIKLSRIASLGDDLAMAMEALRVRIVAPIPGKGVVGFEVPNKQRETVFLKEVVEQEAFQKGASRLTMAIGKDIEGMPYVSDLAKMPHLLIAGTTGSGKSVGVNSMLVSMLMRATPEELRFIMVDPKMLELSIYEGIPHLLLPVVTDPKKAALALRWGVEEMERRYQLLAEAGVRNIAQYNKIIEKELAQKAAAKPVQLELGAEVESDGEPEPERRKLPYIVIVIDELADLMMVAAKEVEVYIARLAQMARAAGIHLMVATQRPSTDVLTGVIKANFPARISFQVASRHDSGTIINTPGAENLLGMGDMLILPPGTSSLVRVHGAYVSETEINKLTAFWKAQGAPVYDPDILRPRDEGGGDDAEDDIADALYDQAIAAVSDMRQVSISLLQRKMRIGYNRAARMIERMERDGIVGPADGSKPRDVLIRPLGEMPGA